MKLKYPIFLVCYTLSLVFCASLPAVSPNVPPESGLYEKLGRLQSFGLIDNFISGINPISREEFARQLKEAIRSRESKSNFLNPAIDQILSELKKEFQEELLEEEKKVSVRMWDEAQVEIVQLEESPTPHLETNSFNKPLVSNRSGENPNDSFNSILKISGWIEFPKYASIYLEPKMIFRQNLNRFDINIPRGNLKFGFKNIELELGRDAQMWGYGYSGKIQLSNNIEGLTMAKLSNPYPAYLPWIFKYLGQMKFVFFFSLLEGEREHPNPAFWGMSIFFKPSKYVEWGLGRTTMLGGEGIEGITFWDYFFEAVTGIRIYDSSKKNIGNGSFAFYFLFTLPFLRNSQIYFDGYLEDFGTENLATKGIMFTRDFAFLTGLNIPRLNKSGTISVKSEFVKTTEITYRNGVYTDGYTHNRNIMGHHIGPDALGSYTRFNYAPKTDLSLGLDFNYERHGRLGLDQDSNPLPPEMFEKPEDRYAVIFTVENSLYKNFHLSTSVGYERIENYIFKSGENKNNAIASLAVKYKF